MKAFPGTCWKFNWQHERSIQIMHWLAYRVEGYMAVGHINTLLIHQHWGNKHCMQEEEEHNCHHATQFLSRERGRKSQPQELVDKGNSRTDVRIVRYITRKKKHSGFSCHRSKVECGELSLSLGNKHKAVSWQKKDYTAVGKMY